MFSENLKAARRRKYPSARQFAHALGIDEHRYRTYERGEWTPNLALLLAICADLSVTPNDLLLAATGQPRKPQPMLAHDIP